MHHGEGGEFVAQQLFVKQRPITFDIAGLLQRPHAPQTGRRRNTDPSRQLNIGDAAIILQLLQDVSVDGIETCGHAGLLNVARHPYPGTSMRETLLRRAVLLYSAAATMPARAPRSAHVA